MGFLLYIASLILSAFIVPAGMLYGLFKQLYKGNFIQSIKDIDDKFLLMACGVDRSGNIADAEFFDDTLIKNSAMRFGNGKETISSVLGKNEASGSLTKLGRWVTRRLNRMREDHCKRSIDTTV